LPRKRRGHWPRSLSNRAKYDRDRRADRRPRLRRSRPRGSGRRPVRRDGTTPVSRAPTTCRRFLTPPILRSRAACCNTVNFRTHRRAFQDGAFCSLKRLSLPANLRSRSERRGRYNGKDQRRNYRIGCHGCQLATLNFRRSLAIGAPQGGARLHWIRKLGM
jgi:hypothetical protein